MNKKTIVIILILVFVLLIVGASVLYTQLSNDETPDLLQTPVDQNNKDNESQTDSSGTNGTEQTLIKAPDFAVYDASGNKVNLSDYKVSPSFKTCHSK